MPPPDQSRVTCLFDVVERVPEREVRSVAGGGRTVHVFHGARIAAAVLSDRQITVAGKRLAPSPSRGVSRCSAAARSESAASVRARDGRGTTGLGLRRSHRRSHDHRQFPRLPAVPGAAAPDRKQDNHEAELPHHPRDGVGE